LIQEKENKSKDQYMKTRHLRLWAPATASLVAVTLFTGCAIKELRGYYNGAYAYEYGFPLVMMDVTRAVVTATNQTGEYKAPINQFGRMRTYVSPDFKDVVRINVNSLWSHVFLDLDREPFIISVPDMKGRYIVLQALNMWTDDFASVGTRTTEGKAGNYLIAGPKWQGTAPADVNETFRCETRYAWVLVQMSAGSPADFPEIHALQDQLKATPLSAWGKPYTPPDNVPVDPTVDTTATPIDQVSWMDGPTFFKRLSVALNDNPPYTADTSMVKKLKKLGIEPGKDFDATKVDPAVARGMTKAATKVFGMLGTAQYSMKGPNGWLLPVDLGAYGTDYATRAFVAYMGLGALTKDDAVYPTAFVDEEGKILDGSSKYVMHFEKDGVPPSHCGVWSISPYRGNFYVRNSLNKYGVLSSANFKYNADGSLDIYIQRDSPGADKEANWLPIPPSGPFNLTIRVYQPKKEIMDGKTKNNLIVEPSTYKIPPVRKVALEFCKALIACAPPWLWKTQPCLRRCG
jgi:hypothetical protein